MSSNLESGKTEQLLKIISRIPIFSQTPENVLIEIALSLREKFYKKDETIVKKGDRGDSMFIINEGSLKVHDGDYIFSHLTKHDVFGEYYLIDCKERSASVTAISDVSVFMICQDDFYLIMSNNNSILKGILKYFVTRLRRMNNIEEALAESIQSKNKFFSIIAHDLRSPLGSIISLLEYLSSEPEMNQNEMNSFHKNLYASSTQLLKLLDNLLMWSRSKSGNMPFTPEKLNIKKLLEDNARLASGQAQKKDIALEVNIHENLFAFADSNMAYTILRNLLSNAIKFTNKGGKIKLDACQKNNYCLVSVTDNGIGIAEEKKKNLFNLSVRQNTKGTMDESGSGLGLSLCKEFTEKNGGRIWIDSDYGKGSCVTFTIPLYTDSQPKR